MDKSFDKKKMTIIINQIEYTVFLRFSVDDYIYLIDFLENKNDAFSVAVATVLLKHISPLPPTGITANDIAKDKNIIEQYILALVKTNKDLSVSFERFKDEEDLQIRFKETIKYCTKTMTENLSAAVAGFKAYLPEQNLMITNIQKSLEPFISISKKIGRLVAGFDNRFKPIFEKIKVPFITDERKEEIRLSFETWGTFGWTIIPSARFKLFYDVPNSLEKANEIALKHCNKEVLVDLFERTRNLKGVKSKDFEEAIFAFYNRKYKSCAMILLSLIDSKLIRMQRKEDRNSKGKRRSGLGAIRQIEKRINSEQDTTKKFLLLLSYANLFACLKVIFSDGDDFRKQPKIINRNFVDHGMLTRNVRRRDCIQLFLLYYNFLEFFDLYINN